MRRLSYVIALLTTGASFALMTAAGCFPFLDETSGSRTTNSTGSTGGTEVSVPCSSPATCDDDNPCTTDACTSERCTHVPTAKGTACTSMAKPSAKVCDGNGTCVGCTANDDCTEGMQPSCDTTTHTCISCSDGMPNGGETGVDCGGTCPKCDGESCAQGVDCKSGTCADQVCCDTVCTGVCFACDLPGKKGACTAIPKGLEDSMCTGVAFACRGDGVCMSGVTGSAGTLCSTDSACYTGACNGMCRLPDAALCAQAAECASLRCEGNRCTACLNDNECPGNKCVLGRCKIADGGVCSDNGDCASSACEPIKRLCGKGLGADCANGSECATSYCNATTSKCAACAPATQEDDCPSHMCDPNGSCLLAATKPCTADWQCASHKCDQTFPARCQSQ